MPRSRPSSRLRRRSGRRCWSRGRRPLRLHETLDEAVAQAPVEVLAASFSMIAARLYAVGTVQGTLQRIVNLAADTLEGCDHTGVALVEKDRITTAAATDQLVVRIDELQYAADEGLCIDALSLRGTLSEDPGNEVGWPAFSAPAAGLGVGSVLAYPLSSGPDLLGSLNLYASGRRAFTSQTRQALVSRDVIGPAKGMLVES
jgi:GAF domain-containing protein